MLKYRIIALLLLVSTAATGCGPADKRATQTDNPATAEVLDPVIGDYVELTRRESPGAEMLSADAFRGEIDTRKALLARARRVSSDDLSRAADIDRRLVIGLLESSINTAESRQIWAKDPALYIPVQEINAALDALAVTPTAERETGLAALLKTLPERFDHARSNLQRPPRWFVDEAIYQLRETLTSLAAAAGDFTGKELTQAATDAAGALDDYLQFLETDVLPRADGSWAFGRESYDYVLKHRWFMEADADDILTRGRTAFRETEALAQQVAERIEPGSNWIEVYEKLKDAHPPADGIKAAYQRQMDRARAFVRERKLVTLPAGEHVITVDTPKALRRSSPFGTFDGVDPFGDDLEGRLVLTPIEDWLDGDRREQRLRSHHNAWIPIIAVHEAYPGHHVHALKIRENPRLLRKVVQEPIFSEGWGLYTEELMYQLGFLQGDEVRLTQLRNRLWRAARVILDVQLHTGTLTFDEAVDFLVDKVRFERYAAELEVGMYIRRPTYVLGYLIGMQEIAKLKDDYYARFGEPDPPSLFFDQLLSAGSIPPALVREALLSP